MNSKLTHAQAVGLGLVLAVILGMASVGLFATARHQQWGTPAVELCTGLRRSPGLRIGSPVRLLGTRVGQVTAIELPNQPEAPVMVRFSLDANRLALVRADATVQLVKDGMLGERVLEIDPGTCAAEPAKPGECLVAVNAVEVEDLVRRLEGLVDQVERGEGSLGKLIASDETHDAMRDLMHKAETSLATLDEAYGAARQNWMLKPFLKDRYELLVRPGSHAHRKVLPEELLFDHGRSVLTAQGREKLDEVAAWLREFDPYEGEVLVCAFADDEKDGRLAEVLTRQQAQVVRDYLVNQHAIHRTGWVSRRTVQCEGMGNCGDPSGRQASSRRRVEVLAFLNASG